MSNLIHKTNQLGFTLIEVMIVIIIIAIMSTLGITNYLNFMEDNQVKVSAQDVQVFLRDVQNRAKMGDRGKGSCAAVSGNTVLNKVFTGWQVVLYNEVWATPTCSTGTGDRETLILPSHMKAMGAPPSFSYPSLYKNPSNNSNIDVYVYDDRDKNLCYKFVIAPSGGMTKPEKSTFCHSIPW